MYYMTDELHDEVKKHYKKLGTLGSAALADKLGENKSAHYRKLQKKSVKARKKMGFEK